MLARSIRGIQADCLDLTGEPLNDLSLIVNAVDGLEQGAYVDEGRCYLQLSGWYV